ncbi:MAG: PilZ domain-containing protein [Acidobacteriaceae bacterium]
MDEKQSVGPGPGAAPASEAEDQSPELRTAVRFPVQVPVQVKTDHGSEQAVTINVSACGMLFAYNRRLEAGSPIEWDLQMPAGTLGTEKDVVVHCVGRVVRCYQKGGAEVEIAAVIDRYQMLT